MDEELPEKGLCAHRGAMTTHPENTMAAFKEAIRVGAQMIEFDVQLSRDGALVIMHDATVDRTTDGSGRVADMTVEEIRALDAGSWKGEVFGGEKVPLLEEVLDIMPRNIWLNIHLKGTAETGKRVAEVIHKTGRWHQAVLAVEEEAREGARSAFPEIKICNMERQSGSWDYARGTVDMKAGFLQLRGGIDPVFSEIADYLHGQGVKVNYFGTDDPDEIRQLWEMGVDFPLVNDIVSAMEVGEAYGIQRVRPIQLSF